MTTTNRRLNGRPETITLGQLMDHQFPRRENLVFPWLRQGESAMIWAAPGVGKTLLTLTIALAVAGGGQVLGWESPGPRKVLLVDGEMSAEDLQERMAMLMETVEGIDRDAARRNLMVLSRNWQDGNVRFPDLGEREAPEGRDAGQEVVFQTAREAGAELVILDNFATLAEVADENDAAAMSPTLAFLLRLKQARIGCVLVHHSGKTGESYRGSSKLATTFEVILGLRAAADPGRPEEGAAFHIEWTKYRRERSEGVRDCLARLGKTEDGLAAWKREQSMDADCHRLLQELQTGAHGSQSAVAKALRWEPSKVTRVKQQAVRKGIITDAEVREWLSAPAAGADMDF